MGRAIAEDWQLFQAVESGRCPFAFRIWETVRPAVVVGRSNVIADHVVETACRADGVPIVRRFSGGGAVVLGPGCLNYAVALSLVRAPSLHDVAASFSVILGRLAAGLGVASVEIRGGTDLVMNDRKISGNAQRRGRVTLLHHGTLLYDFDAAFATRYLHEPARRPDYRGLRSHADFLGNLPMTRAEAQSRLQLALDGLRVIVRGGARAAGELRAADSGAG